MSGTYCVKVGDRCKFWFSSGKSVFGKVLHIPASPHGPTIVQVYYEGREDYISYIFNCERMDILQKGD